MAMTEHFSLAASPCLRVPSERGSCRRVCLVPPQPSITTADGLGGRFGTGTKNSGTATGSACSAILRAVGSSKLLGHWCKRGTISMKNPGDWQGSETGLRSRMCTLLLPCYSRNSTAKVSLKSQRHFLFW